MPRYIRYLENGEYKYASVKEVGDMTQLKTNAKGSLVEAINELIEGGVLEIVQQDLDKITQDIDTLETTVGGQQTTIQQQATSISSAQELINALQEDTLNLNDKADALEAKTQTIESDLLNKANVTYVDGKLATKLDLTKYETEYNQTKTDLLEKVDINRYEQEYATIVENVNQKADDAVVQDIVNSINGDIAVQQQVVDQVKTDVVTLDVKVEATKQDLLTDITNTQTKATNDLSTAKQELQGVIDVTNSNVTALNTSLNQAKTDLTNKINSDIASTNQTVSNLTSRVSTAETDIAQNSESILLKANSSDVYVKNEIDGALSDKVDTVVYNAKMSEIKLTTDGISQKVSDVEGELDTQSGQITTINQNVSAVDQKADSIQSSVTSLSGTVTNQGTRLSSAETTIGQHANSISLKANAVDVYTKTESDGKISTAVSNAKSEIAITTDGITQSVNELNQTVTEQGSQIVNQQSTIEQLSDQISLKVEHGEFDELTQQVSVQETSILQTANDITLLASRTEDAEDRLTVAEASINVQAGQITLKAEKSDVYTKSEVNTELGKKVDTTTYNSKVSEIKATTDGITQTVSNVSAKVDGIQVGGRNLLSDGDIERTSVSIVNYTYDLRTLTPLIGQQITISFEAKKSQAGTFNIDCYLRNVDSASIVGASSPLMSITDNYARYVYTLTVPSGVDVVTNGSVAIRGNHQAGSFSVKNVKVEKGNQATDWTPSVETIDSKISTVDQKADSIQSSVASLSSTVTSQGTRLTNAETTITQHTNSISLKAEKSDVYTKSETDTKVNDAKSYFSKSGWKYEGSYPETSSFTFGKIPAEYKDNMVLRFYAYDFESGITIKVNGTQLTPNPSGADNETKWYEYKIPSSSINTTSDNIVEFAKLSSDGGTIYTVVLEFDSKGYADSAVTTAKAEIKVTTDSITQSVTNANAKIDNLQIGGRNLLLNSSLRKTTDKWTVYNGGASFVNTDGYDSLKIVGALGSTRTVNQSLMGKLIAGQTYTVSGWWKVEDIVKGTTNFNIMFYVDGYYNNNGTSTWYGLGSKNIDVTQTGWQYVSYQFTADSRYATATSCNFYGYTRDYTGNVYMRDFKIEKGSKSTDWTPAPEDIDTQFASVDSQISTINQTATSISTRVSETESDISSLEGRVSTAETNITQTKNDITLKADKSTTDSLGTRLTTAEGQLTVQAGQIATKVSQTEYESAIGLNKWIVSKYENLGVTLSGVSPSFSMISQKTPTESKEVLDAQNMIVYTGVTNVLTHYFTNVYLNAGKTVTLSVKHDDGLAIFLNGANIYQSSYNMTTATAVPIVFKAGWNTLEMIHTEASGSESLDLGLKLSTQVDKLTALIGVGDKDQTRLIQAESSIKQNADAIALKASQTSVTDLGNRVTTAEGTLTVHTNQIASKVSQTDFNAYSDRVTTAESNITQLNNSITQKVDVTDYDLLNDTVVEQQTMIQQMNESIALKVDEHVFDGMNNRVTEAETQISLTKDSILLKADQTELDTATGRLTDAEASIQIQADQITQKVSKTDVDAYAGAVKKVRYIRDHLDGSTANAGNHWVEIKAFVKGVNVAKGKAVTASNSGTNLTRVTDDVHTDSNVWASANNIAVTAWVQVDLGQVYEDIDTIQVWHYYADGRTYYETKTEISTDGTNWQIVFDSAITGTYKETVNGNVIPINIGNGLVDLATRMKSAETSITQTASDITLKANQSDLTTTNSNLGALTTRVTNAESSLTVQAGQIATKVSQTEFDSLTIGGRNLVLNSNTYITSGSKQLDHLLTIDDIPKSKYTMSVDIDIVNATKGTTNGRIGMEFNVAYSDGTYSYFGIWEGGITDASPKTVKKRLTLTFGGAPYAKTPVSISRVGIYVQCNGDSLKIGRPKIEKGNKATDYTPAHEDVDGQINDLATRVSSTETSITQNTNAIALKASQSELNTLTGRVSTAEGQLTVANNEIASKVSTTTYEQGIKDAIQSTGSWVKGYSVNTATPTLLRDTNGGMLSDAYSYEVQARTTGTSTESTAIAYFISKGDGQGWTLTKQYEMGTSSNHPEFFLDANGNPSIRLYSHTSMYNVEVKHVAYRGRTIPSLKTSQQEASNAVNDIDTMTKLNGLELLNQTYTSDVNAKPLPLGGGYQIVPASELSLTDNKNLIKVTDSKHLISDYIPYSNSNPIYLKASVYNQTTTNGTFYVGIEYFDKDKVSLGANDLTIYAIQQSSGNIPVNTWKTFEGFVKVGSDVSRNKAGFIRLRILTRWSGQTGVTYLKELSVRQLGSYNNSILETKISSAETSITQLSNSISLKAEKTDVYTKTEVNNKVSTDIATAKSEIQVTTDSITSRVQKAEINNATLKKVRYIRDWINGSSANTSNHWIEVQAFVGGVNVAKDKVVTGSSTESSTYPYSRVTDGNDSTFGQSGAVGLQWVQVDLGSIREDIEYLIVKHYYSDGRTYNTTKTEVSEDGTTWTTLFDSSIAGTYKEIPAGKVIPVNIGVGLHNQATQIKQTSDEVSLNVVKKNNVLASINASSEGVKISGNLIEINGTTTFASGYDPSTKETPSGAQAKADEAKELARATALGKMLYTDPTFVSGSNGISVYNNSQNGNVAISRIAKPSDAPTTSGYAYEMKSTGTASPNWGGFSFGNPSRANAIFVTKIIAKIPVGYQINWNSNVTGTGGASKWLTSQAGTGKYEEYIYKVTCGSTGTFSSTNYFSISGSPAPTSTTPLIWYVAYATVFDVTDNDYTVKDMKTLTDGWKMPNKTTINGGSIETGTITASHISTAGLDANIIKSGTIDASVISVTNLSASNITTGTLSANKISGGTIDASSINVTNLNASNITGGTLNASYVNVVGTLTVGDEINLGTSQSAWKTLRFANSATISGSGSGMGGFAELKFSANSLSTLGVKEIWTDASINWYGQSQRFNQIMYFGSKAIFEGEANFTGATIVGLDLRPRFG